MSNTPIFDNLNNGGPVVDIPKDKIPAPFRTAGYVGIAAWSVLSPLVPFIGIPADLWIAIGASVGAYAGIVGVVYRGTR